jgi:hypothetical protein
MKNDCAAEDHQNIADVLSTQSWSWNEQKYSYGALRAPKPRMGVLAKASRKLLICSLQS